MKLESLRKLAEGRTKGKWTPEFLCITPDGKDAEEIVTAEGPDWVSYKREDSAFIAAMANHIDALLDVAEAAQKSFRYSMEENLGDLAAALDRLEAIK